MMAPLTPHNLSEKKLSLQAQQWLDSYKPRKSNFFVDLISRFFFDAPAARPATLEKDRLLLELLASQCEKQNVNFPKRVIIHKSPVFNGSYVPFGIYNFTSGLVETRSIDSIEPVVAHEVGHAAQKTLWAGFFAVAIATSLIINIGYDLMVKTLKKQPLSPLKQLGKVLEAPVIKSPLDYLGLMYVMSAYGRQMELDADKRGALNTSPEKQISSLKEIHHKMHEYFQEGGGKSQNWAKKVTRQVLFPFPRHPPLQERINHIEKLKQDNHNQSFNR